MIYLQDIPKQYTYCFAGKDLCPKAGTCLRAIAAQLLSDSREKVTKKIISVVNPVYVARLSAPGTCTFYRDSEPVRFAKGMTRLFDNLPLKQAHAVRLHVMRCFSCESYFYHSRNGKRLISPEEQKAILRAFSSADSTFVPEFDEYVYAINW